MPTICFNAVTFGEVFPNAALSVDSYSVSNTGVLSFFARIYANESAQIDNKQAVGDLNSSIQLSPEQLDFSIAALAPIAEEAAIAHLKSHNLIG